jgi:hypothetical protein
MAAAKRGLASSSLLLLLTLISPVVYGIFTLLGEFDIAKSLTFIKALPINENTLVFAIVFPVALIYPGKFLDVIRRAKDGKMPPARRKIVLACLDANKFSGYIQMAILSMIFITDEIGLQCVSDVLNQWKRMVWLVTFILVVMIQLLRDTLRSHATSAERMAPSDNNMGHINE